MIKNKKGISLIVLSITILVMAILAATAIIALEDSGIIGRSKNTVSKQNYIQEYERLQVIKNGILTDNFGEITIDEYITELTNKGLIESGVTTNSDGSKSVTTKTGFIANLMQDGETNIIISLGTSNATIALNPTSLSGDITSGPVSKTITATTTNVTGDITWTSSNSSVASVTGTNSSATVTLKGIGQATITATYGNAKATCNVTVTGTVATPTITLNKTTISKTIDAGTTATETIVATTANISGTLTWMSSNVNVATVSASGNTATVTIKSDGTAIISAKSGSVIASCTIVVTENAPVVSGCTLSGTWVLNSEILRGTTVGPMLQEINFTSNGTSYVSIEVYNDTWTLPSGASGNEGFVDYNTSSGSVQVFNSSVLLGEDKAAEDAYWEATAYRTVDFGTTPQAVSEEFYNWFIANATQSTSSANLVERSIYFTNGSYLMTADADATWEEIIGEGITVVDTQGTEWDFMLIGNKIEIVTEDDSPGGPTSGNTVLATDTFGKYARYYYNQTDSTIDGEY